MTKRSELVYKESGHSPRPKAPARLSTLPPRSRAGAAAVEWLVNVLCVVLLCGAIWLRSDELGRVAMRVLSGEHDD